MNDLVITYLVLWFIVYPLILVILLFIVKAAYARHAETTRKRNHIEALKRIDERQQNVFDYWGFKQDR